jgi:hypothetical protein
VLERVLRNLLARDEATDDDHLRRCARVGEVDHRLLPSLDPDPVLVSPAREHPGKTARRHRRAAADRLVNTYGRDYPQDARDLTEGEVRILNRSSMLSCYFDPCG